MNPVHEKLMKLLALAARGEGGERANAQANTPAFSGLSAGMLCYVILSNLEELT